MQVAKDTLVTISAKMYNLQGDLMESADELVYLHGHRDIFPVIEKALEGKKPGETVTVQLEPEEAFGDYDETALIIRPETDFEEGVEVGLSYTEIRGETLDRVYRVTDIADGVVVLDGNHPLAGIGLKFEITVKNVEPVKKAWKQSVRTKWWFLPFYRFPISPWWLTLLMMRATSQLIPPCISR